MEPDPYIQFLENWIPGIGEDTRLHDQLHLHFDLGFSINDEAKLLGFQLGHHHPDKNNENKIKSIRQIVRYCV